jgi:integrase
MSRRGELAGRATHITLMLGSGLKLREALPIKLQDILLDYSPPVIHVVNGTRGSSRYVSINPTWRPGFRACVERLKEHRPPGRFLFPGRAPDRPSGRETLTGWWKQFLQEAGLRHIPVEKGTHVRFGIWESKRLPPQRLIDGQSGRLT